MNWIRRLAPLISLFLMVAAFLLIYRELKHIHFQDIRQELKNIPPWRLWSAIGLTALNYFILIGYDFLAVRSVGKHIPLRLVALASFTGFATSYNVNALFGGTAIRYRFYSQWGLSTVELARLLVMLGTTFWIGVLSLAGLVFTFTALRLPADWHLPFHSLRPLGIVLLGLTTGYLLTTAFRTRPIKFRKFEVILPTFTEAMSQLFVASLDLTVAAGALYVLIGADIEIDYISFLGVYLMAMMAVIFTHVPGGVGVFELVVITLSGASTTPELVASLVIFRVIYYLFPLAVAMLLLAGHEIIPNRDKVRSHLNAQANQAWRQTRRWWPAVAPSIIGMAVLLSGAVLLLSTATPGESSRLRWLGSFVPLSLLEASHFLGSIIGVCLLFLARGLQRRLDTAYWVTIALLILGIFACLLKGFDYEESTFLGIVLIGLVPCRQAFYRRGNLLSQPLTPAWISAIGLVIFCAGWLGFFAYKHVEFRDQLWWKFAIQGDAPRFLRAGVGVAGTLLVFGILRLLAPSGPKPKSVSPDELSAAKLIADKSPRTNAQLVMLADKQIFFNEDRSAFIMYGVQGRSWVSMGDPIGPEKEWPDLVWKYREMVDRFGGWPVFYQVDTDHLTVYLDQGLTLLKIGEEARVDLSTFSLEGSSRKGLRQTVNRMKREKATFEILPPETVAEVLPQLRIVSDAWIAEKSAKEKGFSLGFFEESYIAGYSCGIVRHQGNIVAFANIWQSGNCEELSIDLMRYLDTAPSGVMEYLFIELMLWGKANGYRWFNLGMAPLSGIETGRLAPMWNRITNLLFRHGDHFYSFEGLRKYKEKFQPEWRSKYLAVPGGAALPRVLTDLPQLIGRRRSTGMDRNL